MEELIPPIKCPKCKDRFWSKTELINHYRGTHHVTA
jgi:hypothetical protein